ncbi:30S ribosomal protein S20 [Chloroflexota bacterium]
MPVTKSAQKQMRVAERKRLRNQPIRSQCKTNITKAEKLIFSGELETAQKAVVAAISSLDKAAEKGVIHPNNAARRKSRLMKKLNEAQSSSSGKDSPPTIE